MDHPWRTVTNAARWSVGAAPCRKSSERVSDAEGQFGNAVVQRAPGEVADHGQDYRDDPASDKGDG